MTHVSQLAIINGWNVICVEALLRENCNKKILEKISTSTALQIFYQHQCGFNLHYECTCLFSCMLSSRMHRTAVCALQCIASSPLVEPFPIMTTSVWSPAAAWVSLSDGANESHVTLGRGVGEPCRVKVNQGKIMLKLWNVPVSRFSYNFLQLSSRKKKTSEETCRHDLCSFVPP